MWKESIEYLKDPHLVARFQETFGIKICYEENASGSIVIGRRDRSGSEKHMRSEEDAAFDSERDRLNGYRASTKELVNRRKTGECSEESTGEQSVDAQRCAVPFIVTNKFWYYLFLFGTELGDEIFYSAFIPFWFWNIDGSVGRRVVLVWATVMSIGQALKDVICWPRPACPPAVRLQQKWSQEYGMPSTHAMVGISIPFGVVLFTMDKYIYPLTVGYTIATLWCMLVCASRIYLGMHTIFDVIVGLLLAILFMIPLVPLVDAMDYYIVTNFGALAVLIAISILAIAYYPCGEKWTPTRGDTTMVVSVTAGVHVGAWLNYKTGVMIPSMIPPPYRIVWLSYSLLARLILRTVLGFSGVIATKVICKPLSYAAMRAILQVDSEELTNNRGDLSRNSNKILTDLVYKYVTCFMIGVNTVYLLPTVFSMLGIERPTFYMEI